MSVEAPATRAGGFIWSIAIVRPPVQDKRDFHRTASGPPTAFGR